MNLCNNVFNAGQLYIAAACWCTSANTYLDFNSYIIRWKEDAVDEYHNGFNVFQVLSFGATHVAYGSWTSSESYLDSLDGITHFLVFADPGFQSPSDGSILIYKFSVRINNALTGLGLI
jgi:hypothetical protein